MCHRGFQGLTGQTSPDAPQHREQGRYVLAAGLPWFMAVFGRDSVISAIQTKILGPDLMFGTLETLARFQALDFDEFREAQPGKIPRYGKGNCPISRRSPTPDTTGASIRHRCSWCC